MNDVLPALFSPTKKVIGRTSIGGASAKHLKSVKVIWNIVFQRWLRFLPPTLSEFLFLSTSPS